MYLLNSLFGQGINRIDGIRCASYSPSVVGPLKSLAIICILCPLLQSCATSGLGTERQEPIPLGEVVRQVTVALNQFRNTEEAQYAELTAAEFNFQTVKGNKGELSVKPLFIGFSLSASREVTKTS